MTTRILLNYILPGLDVHEYAVIELLLDRAGKTEVAVEDACTELSRSCTDLEAQNEELTQEIDELTADLERSTAEVTRLKTELTALKGENEDLKAWKNGEHVRNYREMMTWHERAGKLAAVLEFVLDNGMTEEARTMSGVAVAEYRTANGGRE